MTMRGLGVVVSCLVGLHLAASVQFPWSLAGSLVAMQRLDPDLLALLAVTLLAGAAGWPRFVAQLAAPLFLVSILFRLASSHLLVHHERAFDLADLRDVPGLYHLLLHEQPGWVQVAAVAGLVLALLALDQLAAWAFARIGRLAGNARGATLAAVLLQLLVLVAPVRDSSGRRGPACWHPSSLGVAMQQAARLAGEWLDPDSVDAPIRRQIAAAQARLAAAPADLGGLAGADVHILFLESYGAVAIRHAELGAQNRALWRELGPQLQAAGFSARTGICRPSVYGGFSWLAHAELFAGLHTADRRTWELLHESELKPLPKLFHEAGYYAAEVLPTMHIHWPAGQRFHGFDEEITQLELGYRGTVYHFGLMPDQYALHHLLERVVKPATQPVFSVFVSVTSHAPFQKIPPYIDDWRISADTFAQPPRIDRAITVMDMLDNPLLLPAYQDVVEYSLRCVVGFITRLQRPSLVIVLGDHQPPIARHVLPGDASRDVPMHVFANRPELLAPFAAMGFAEGTDEPAERKVFDTADFAGMFLRGFTKKPQ